MSPPEATAQLRLFLCHFTKVRSAPGAKGGTKREKTKKEKKKKKEMKGREMNEEKRLEKDPTRTTRGGCSSVAVCGMLSPPAI